MNHLLLDEDVEFLRTKYSSSHWPILEYIPKKPPPNIEAYLGKSHACLAVAYINGVQPSTGVPFEEFWTTQARQLYAYSASLTARLTAICKATSDRPAERKVAHATVYWIEAACAQEFALNSERAWSALAMCQYWLGRAEELNSWAWPKALSVQTEPLNYRPSEDVDKVISDLDGLASYCARSDRTGRALFVELFPYISNAVDNGAARWAIIDVLANHGCTIGHSTFRRWFKNEAARLTEERAVKPR